MHRSIGTIATTPVPSVALRSLSVATTTWKLSLPSRCRPSCSTFANRRAAPSSRARCATVSTSIARARRAAGRWMPYAAACVPPASMLTIPSVLKPRCAPSCHVSSCGLLLPLPSHSFHTSAAAPCCRQSASCPLSATARTPLSSSVSVMPCCWQYRLLLVRIVSNTSLPVLFCAS